MAKANRETLKSYFGTGHIPTETQFGTLIDSMVNVVDDGIDKSAGSGLQLAPLEEDGPVLEFFGHILDRLPLWLIRIDRRSGKMKICRGEDGEELLVLAADGRAEWKGNLCLNGKIEAAGFIGNYNRGEVAADGEWHDITCEQENGKAGCRAYRVMAGCGKKGEGKYALLEATAMHCYGSHRRIRSLQSWFGRHFNRLRLRWHREGESWRLQLRSRCNYGEGVMIRFRVTELWDDYYMADVADEDLENQGHIPSGL